jgi:hypothetical protein
LQSGGGIGWSLPKGVEAIWSGEGQWKITLIEFNHMSLKTRKSLPEALFEAGTVRMRPHFSDSWDDLARQSGNYPRSNIQWPGLGHYFRYFGLYDIHTIRCSSCMSPNLCGKTRAWTSRSETGDRVKALLRTSVIISCLAVLGAVMAYLAGMFETKIAVDRPDRQDKVTEGQNDILVEIQEPLMEQAVGTLRAWVETVISPIITASIVSIALGAGDEVKKVIA